LIDDSTGIGAGTGRLAALPIALHDHVIVGNGRWFSFWREGLL
jgi:DNA repair protein RadC